MEAECKSGSEVRTHRERRHWRISQLYFATYDQPGNGVTDEIEDPCIGIGRRVRLRIGNMPANRPAVIRQCNLGRIRIQKDTKVDLGGTCKAKQFYRLRLQSLARQSIVSQDIQCMTVR